MQNKLTVKPAHTHLSSSCRCFSSCSFWIRARRRLSASSLDASSASVVPPTLLPVGVPGDSVCAQRDKDDGAGRRCSATDDECKIGLSVIQKCFRKTLSTQKNSPLFSSTFLLPGERNSLVWTEVFLFSMNIDNKYSLILKPPSPKTKEYIKTLLFK